MPKTTRKKIDSALRQSEEEFRLAFENAKDAIFWADSETGLIVKCNRAAGNLLERKKEDIINRPQTFLHPPDKTKSYARMFKKHIQTKGALDDEAEVITRSGKIKPVHISAAVTSVGGKAIIQGIFRDISESKQAQKKLEILNRQLLNANKKMKQLSLKDPCTGLYNHRYLEEVIEIEFSRARRYAHPISAIMIDLDYFRSINDTYGHHFGDLILKQFAGLLLKMVRRYDIVIRFGGEEFIIISPGVDRQAALNLAQRILSGISFYNFGNKEHAIKLKLSIAVASYPEDGLNKGMELIQAAEHILDKAKECGGNRAFSSLDVKNGSPLAFKSEEGSDVHILREKISRLTKQANEGLIEAIFAFAKAIELKDHYTGEHVERTVGYSTEIAKAMDLDQELTENIRQASILHDLGKIGISEKILCKKSKLTRNEFEEIKKHPQIGADILRPIHFLQSIIPLILYHHARWDGQGYPDNLKGKEIPVGARIIAVADVYQALISDRAYRKALSRKKAMEIIKKGSGTQFDPEIVDVFLRILKKQD